MSKRMLLGALGGVLLGAVVGGSIGLVLGGPDAISRAMLLRRHRHGRGPSSAAPMAADPKKVFGSSNDREIKRLRPLGRADQPVRRGDRRRCSDEELRAKTDAFRARIREATAGERAELERLRALLREPHREDGPITREPARSRSTSQEDALYKAEQAVLDEILPEAFACVREASRRTIGLRHYDVQMLGGIVLHQGHHRRDEDRRGQDPGRDAADLPQRADRPRRAPGDGQRLPGPPRRAVDGADLPRARHHLSPSIVHDTELPLRPERTWSRTTACSTCARSSARWRTRRTSPTAPTTSSASTTCATT